MDLANLITALANSAAYPFPAKDVEVLQTHISAVFLAGAYAYKIKKPVNFGFVDFSTLEKRLYFCEQEVKLNRRLAPSVYLGVVPVAQTAGGPKFEGTGEVIEWAVKMRRLPEAATLRERLRRGEITVPSIEAVARKIASFHQEADSNETIAEFGRFEAVARNLRDIFNQSEKQVGATVSQVVFERLRALTEGNLSSLRPSIDERARQGKTRDMHGDLHLDHIYLFPEEPAPGDLVIVDCIEFNDRFRFLDPVADMAFPVMDFEFYGRRDLARAFADAYFQCTSDDEGRALLSLYSAYRATVRGSVEGLKLAEKEISESDRALTLESSRAHWLLALEELEEPSRKPCLVLVGGLPGTGKSALAQGLAAVAGFEVIRSDVVRKELAGLPGQEPTPSHLRETIYTTQWNDKTYTECLRRAKDLLFEGKRVIVDATFREEKRRRRFLDGATRCGVRGLLLLCQAKPGTVRGRLEKRQSDPSDADWSVYSRMAERWEAIGELTAPTLSKITTDGTPEQGLSQALEALRKADLL
jgi:aminoglycoside phosphotransferase family enzyme/predicted kinase